MVRHGQLSALLFTPSTPLLIVEQKWQLLNMTNEPELQIVEIEKEEPDYYLEYTILNGPDELYQPRHSDISQNHLN